MPRHYTKHSEVRIIEAVNVSQSWAGVCRFLGIKPACGNQTHLKKRAVGLNVNFSHFTGQSHNKGKVFGPKKSVKEYLIEGSTAKSHDLKLRLVKEGIKEYRCECCGLTEWMGEELPLELDHINSDHYDCRIENLQILCPNCHAQKTRKDRQRLVYPNLAEEQGLDP